MIFKSVYENIIKESTHKDSTHITLPKLITEKM